MKNKILRYLAAMNASAFDAAVHAVVLFCGVAGAHEITGSVTALNVQQLGWLFLIAFGRAVLAYLDAHPLSQLTAGGGDGPSPLPATSGHKLSPPPSAPTINTAGIHIPPPDPHSTPSSPT